MNRFPQPDDTMADVVPPTAGRFVWILSIGQFDEPIAFHGAFATLEGARAFLDNHERYPGAETGRFHLDHETSDLTGGRLYFRGGWLEAEIRKVRIQ